MDFSFTEDHLEVQKLAKNFAARHIAPNIREQDRKHEFDPTLIGKLKDADLLGICIPEKYGGAGQDYISLGLVCEEMEYVDTSARVIFSVHVGLYQMPICAWGSEELKEKYLVPAARGEKLGCFGLTEPNAGSDVVGLQTTADKDGDYYILNGEKMWISLADVADFFMVFAWTDREKKARRDHSGISAFIVEREYPGLTSASIHGKLGVRAGNTGSFAMNDVRVHKSNMLGLEGEGFKIAMFCLEQGRYTVASGSTGLIRACIDACKSYAAVRKTFGVNIYEHQLVKQMVARMQAGYEFSRLLWLQAGWMKNVGLRNTRESAMAKWIACEQAEKAAADAVQVHGAYGFCDEYPVERFYRNAKGASIYEGTREVQTLMQADYVFGLRSDKPTRCQLPTWPFE